MGSLMVVAGEASGDDFASGVIPHLVASSWGVGGPRSQAAGLQTLAPMPDVMGLFGVAARTGELLRLRAELLRQAKQRFPRAALLVGFSEFNAQLARKLTRLRIPVIWYAPPQIWAWRPHRARDIAPHTTRLAVLFDFEVPLWTKAGGNAHHVGHPAGLLKPSSRTKATSANHGAAAILLPGSRPREVERHTAALTRAATLLLERGTVGKAALALAPSLPSSLASHVRQRCTECGIEPVTGGAAEVLPAFDVAVCCSGTATLECAACGVPPVIVYDAGPLTRPATQLLLRVQHVGLPNLLLAQRVFPELLGSEVRPEPICREVRHILDARPRFESACRSVRERLAPRTDATTTGSTPGERVASLLAPWLK